MPITGTDCLEWDSVRQTKLNSVEETLSGILAGYKNSASKALICDFDGTLAPIINNPAEAKIPEHAAKVLLALTKEIEIVAIASGRGLEFINNAFAPYTDGTGRNPIKIFGLYGSQTDEEEFKKLHKTSVMDQTLKELILQLIAPLVDKIDLELKDSGLVLHYRNYPDFEEEVLSAAQLVADTFPVLFVRGKKAVELTVAGHTDKGDVIDYIAGYADAVCYIGDDYGDIAAFDKVNTGTKGGLSVGVFSEEMPPELYDKCQFILEGTAAVHELLAELLGALSQSATDL